jgi:hypothetical protein
MTILSISWFSLIAAVTLLLTGAILLPLWPRIRQAPGWTRLLLLLAVSASALLLLRPHEDTFTGLDTSCYRLMARSFAAGRGFQDVDTTLLSLPPEQRRAVLLEYKHWGRDTRDRSFQLTSLQTCTTQPYFYPFLPLAAAGLETATRWISGDLFAPFMGLLFFIVILCTGTALGKHTGLAAAAALLVGSPLPAYLLRGFYAEAVGAVLALLVLLGRSLPDRTRAFRIIAPFALGLAVCFHPVMIALSLPALALLLFDPALKKRGIVLSLAGFVLGALPLLLMTLWVCQPYGDITSWPGFLHTLTVAAVHQLLAIFVAAFGIAIGVVLLGTTRLKESLAAGTAAVIGNPVLFLLLILLALAPFAIPTSLWTGKSLIRAGFQEYRDGVRIGYGLLLAIGILSLFFRSTPPISRAILLLTILLSPLFFYLKGFELMGLWSQRRLLPFTLLVIVALTPALAAFCGEWARRRGHLAAAGLTIILLATAAINPIRWPAPYLACHEAGATRWVTSVSGKLGSSLTFFDYYPYGVPFSLIPGCRAIGLSEYGLAALPSLTHWLSTKATREEVLFVTAYNNPGLEEGVTLTERSHETLSMNRVVSKTALPAETRERVIDMRILEARPITGTPSLAVHKILDDGPLAIRGAWGRGSPIRCTEGMLPARWSRQGSQIVGPVPKPGQSIRIAIAAAASRDDGVEGQTLLIHPPWGVASPLALAVSNDLTRTEGFLSRPADDTRALSPTGLYAIRAGKPYDPAKAGIRGYERDLGARIHSISIEILP